MVIPVIMNKVEYNQDNFSFVKKDSKKRKNIKQNEEIVE
jgi:hypothetical protein